MRVKLILVLGVVVTIGGTLYAEGELLITSGFEPSVRVTEEMGHIEGADRAHGHRHLVRWSSEFRQLFCVASRLPDPT